MQYRSFLPIITQSFSLKATALLLSFFLISAFSAHHTAQAASFPSTSHKNAVKTKQNLAKTPQVKTKKNTATNNKATVRKGEKGKRASGVTITSTASGNAQKKVAIKRNSTSSLPSPRYKSALLYDMKTHKTLYSHKANVQIAPASLTKIMAIFVAEDAIRARKLNRNTKVSVSSRAAVAGGSRMGIKAGDKISLDALLHGMAVASGNDASRAVAEYIGGTEKNFVIMMNKKARLLGMNRTVFKNASGLPARGQLTTARDMLILARAYLKAYPDNLQKYHRKTFSEYNGHMANNANPLLRNFKGADGLKTGFVNASGYNLVATAQRNGQRYIGVILGAPSSPARATEALSLMEDCFSNPNRFVATAKPVNTHKAAGGQKVSSGNKGRTNHKRTTSVFTSGNRADKGKKKSFPAVPTRQTTHETVRQTQG